MLRLPMPLRKTGDGSDLLTTEVGAFARLASAFVNTQPVDPANFLSVTQMDRLMDFMEIIDLAQRLRDSGQIVPYNSVSDIRRRLLDDGR